MSLSREEIRRYSRHLLLPEIGVAGQEALARSSVLVVGAGGLGSPAAMYLAAAGVGRLGVADPDVVDESNLHRQIIHGQSDLGRKKVESAAARLSELNPLIELERHDTRLSRDNALELFARYDVIVDGSDNFPTRYLINDACVLLGKPNVYASVFRFEGQLSVFDARVGPCYRCLYPEPPPAGVVPSCADGGVLGVLPGVMGSLQATEAIKQITGAGESLIGRMLTFDALRMSFSDRTLKKNPACAACGSERRLTALVDYEQLCGAPSHDRGLRPPADAWDIRPSELQARLAQGGVCLVDVRQPHEWAICKLETARLIPLEALPRHLHELDSADEIVLYCKVGERSRAALELLRAAGFGKVKSLLGGINAWSREIDQHVALY